MQLKFELGQTVITANASETLPAEEVNQAMARYMSCDWGDLCEEDKQMNDDAVETGDNRILAMYNSSIGKSFYIITEWDRSYTTILLTEDY